MRCEIRQRCKLSRLSDDTRGRLVDEASLDKMNPIVDDYEGFVADIARQWIGTPYVHQASQKGVGSDCLGLVYGIWRELYREEPISIPPYSRDWGEAGGGDYLLDAVSQIFDRVTLRRSIFPGQVLVFRMRRGSIAKHLGVVGQGDPQATFIHSHTGRGVHETALSSPWRQRIAGRFTFPPPN